MEITTWKEGEKVKFIVKSLIGAIALFSIYTAATLTSGYIKTRNFEPDIEAAWANAENLPREVVFGQTSSLVSPAGLFGGMMLLCAAFIFVYDRRKSTRSSGNKLSR